MREREGGILVPSWPQDENVCGRVFLGGSWVQLVSVVGSTLRKGRGLKGWVGGILALPLPQGWANCQVRAAFFVSSFVMVCTIFRRSRYVH